MPSAPLVMPSFAAPPRGTTPSTALETDRLPDGDSATAALAVPSVGSPGEGPMARRSVAQAGRLGRLMDGLTPTSAEGPEPWVPMAESALRAATLRGFPAVAAAIGLWIAARRSRAPMAVAYAERELASGLAASPELMPSVPEVAAVASEMSGAGAGRDIDMPPPVALPQEEIGLMDRILLGRLEIMRALEGAVGLSHEQEPVVRDVVQRIGVMAAGRQDPRDLPGLDFMLSSVILDLRADHGPLAGKLAAWQTTAVAPGRQALRVAHIRKRASLGFAPDLGLAPPSPSVRGLSR